MELCEMVKIGFIEDGIERNVSGGSGYYHCKYLPATGLKNPGEDAVFTPPDANQIGGWNIAADTAKLIGIMRTCSDWDAASDATLNVVWCTNADNTGGNVGDTVDLKCIFRYAGVGDTSIKTQTVEVPVIVGQAAQYTVFETDFTLNYDLADNVLESGDIVSIDLNIETDTSEVDNVIIHHGIYYYKTQVPCIEVPDE